jgi:hypothetical protein
VFGKTAESARLILGGRKGVAVEAVSSEPLSRCIYLLRGNLIGNS